MWRESIVIGLTAQGFSLYSPFWSPVIGSLPVNSISLLTSLGILLSIGYISVVWMPVQAIFSSWRIALVSKTRLVARFLGISLIFYQWLNYRGNYWTKFSHFRGEWRNYRRSNINVGPDLDMLRHKHIMNMNRLALGKLRKVGWFGWNLTYFWSLRPWCLCLLCCPASICRYGSCLLTAIPAPTLGWELLSIAF